MELLKSAIGPPEVNKNLISNQLLSWIGFITINGLVLLGKS